MSFQAYLDNIKEKTGKTPEDFKALAEKKGLLKPGVKAGEIVAWLKEDFGLGHGHAMAIYAVFSDAKTGDKKPEDAIEKHFAGSKSHWRPVFDNLIHKLKELGDDVKIAPTNAYLSLVRGEKKFAVVQITADRMDIGIKLKNAKPTERFQPAGSWNAMVSHRAQLLEPNDLDQELLEWLGRAYEGSGK
jgi:hypothetical protein